MEGLSWGILHAVVTTIKWAWNESDQRHLTIIAGRNKKNSRRINLRKVETGWGNQKATRPVHFRNREATFRNFKTQRTNRWVKFKAHLCYKVIRRYDP